MNIGVGDMVSVDYPITVLNPEQWFEITQIRIDLLTKKSWICGKNTCWFNSDMIMKCKPQHGDYWERDLS